MVDVKRNTFYYVDGTRVVLSSGETQGGQWLQSDDRLIVSNSFGRGADNPFLSTHLLNNGGYITGKLGNARFKRWRRGDMPLNAETVGLTHSRASIANLLAATNPARADVYLPVFVFELRDVPDMIRQAGRFLLRGYAGLQGKLFDFVRPDKIDQDLAAINLALQFGWKPLISDLWKIASLQSSVEKRRKELATLNSKGGLRRKISFGTETQPPQWSGSFANTDLGAFIQSECITTESVTAWGTVRWLPTFPGWMPSDGRLYRQLTGLSADAILPEVWEALPWSWLVDWFIPIQNTLEASNRLVAYPASACIMQTSRRTIAYKGATIIQDASDPLHMDSAKSIMTTRRRDVLNSFPVSLNSTSSFPALGANQLSILGSLAVPRLARLKR